MDRGEKSETKEHGSVKLDDYLLKKGKEEESR
jgi:hypothetical protein